MRSILLLLVPILIVCSSLAVSAATEADGCNEDIRNESTSTNELYDNTVVFGPLTQMLNSYARAGRTATKIRVNIYVFDSKVLESLNFRYSRHNADKYVATQILSVNQIGALSFKPGIDRIGLDR